MQRRLLLETRLRLIRTMNKEPNFGFSGILVPTEETMFNGRVTLRYPDGTVIERDTGLVVKSGHAAPFVVQAMLLQLLVRNTSPSPHMVNGSTTIATADTPQRIQTDSLPAYTVRLEAAAGNSGTVTIGTEQANTSGAIRLDAGDVINLAVSDVNKLWFNGDTQNDVVYYTVFTQ